MKKKNASFTNNNEVKYLKWADETIGIITKDNTVQLYTDTQFEKKHIFKDKINISSDEWADILFDRVISKSRRDIDKFLSNYGLNEYNVFKIANTTRAISPNDKLWIAFNLEEKYKDILNLFFDNILNKERHLGGTPTYSPAGMNEKTYGIYHNKLGIFKKRIAPIITDAESEVAVYKLSQLMKIRVCPAIRVDDNTIFSQFIYNFQDEYIVHFRRLFDSIPENMVEYCINNFPQFNKPLFAMLVLDFVTRQDDRHPSNFSIKVHDDNIEFYDLYDNGKSLFYEDTEEMVKNAVNDPINYCTTFGHVGTYYNHICDMLELYPDIAEDINLNIESKDIEDILIESGFKGYRLNGALQWIEKTLTIVKEKIYEINNELEEDISI